MLCVRQPIQKANERSLRVPWFRVPLNQKPNGKHVGAPSDIAKETASLNRGVHRMDQRESTRPNWNHHAEQQTQISKKSQEYGMCYIRCHSNGPHPLGAERNLCKSSFISVYWRSFAVELLFQGLSLRFRVSCRGVVFEDGGLCRARRAVKILERQQPTGDGALCGGRFRASGIRVHQIIFHYNE
jgi:hypothetical protein